jgi:sporulation protein YlmC with PRC-barrel domain
MQFHKLLGIGAIALSVSGVALAQTSPGSPTTPPPSTNRADPSGPSTTAPSGTMTTPSDRSGATGPAATTGSSSSMPSAFSRMSANDLVGKSVYNAAGERIGEIDDIVLSKSAASQPEAVIGVGGFLGIGEKKAAVPLNSLSMQGDRIVASNLTKEQVQSMSNYSASDYDRYDRNKTLGDAR